MANYAQTINEADARLIRFIGNPDKASDASDAGAVLVRGWFYLAVNAATGNTIKDLLTTLQGVSTYTNPKASGQTYSGTWINSQTEGLDEEKSGDGIRAGTIIQTLIRVLTPTTAEALSNIAPKVLQTNEIIDLFAINTGERDLVGLTWDNLSPTVRSDLMSLSDDSLENIASTYVSGISYDQRKWEEKDDKTCAFSILCRKTIFTEVNNASYYYARWIPAIAKQEETEIVIWNNLTENAATIIYHDAKTNANDLSVATYAPAPSGHKLKYVDKDYNTEGGYTVQRVSYKPSNLTAVVWPPGHDEVNGYYYDVQYRRITESDTGYIQDQSRTWRYRKVIKYCVTACQVQSFLDDWAATIAANSSLTLDEMSWRPLDNTGTQWEAWVKYIDYDSGWVVDL